MITTEVIWAALRAIALTSSDLPSPNTHKPLAGPPGLDELDYPEFVCCPNWQHHKAPANVELTRYCKACDVLTTELRCFVCGGRTVWDSSHFNIFASRGQQADSHVGRAEANEFNARIWSEFWSERDARTGEGRAA